MVNDRRKNKPGESDDKVEIERRKAERRIGNRIPVTIWVEELKGDDVYFQQAGNLSVGGVFFERTIPHPVGTKVRLKFELPENSGVIDTTGEVVNVPNDPSGLGAGIRFVELDAVEQRLIEEYVTKHGDKT